MSNRALIVGCARNCGAHLHAVLANIDTIRGLYVTSDVVFVQNDSTDGTQELLERYRSLRGTTEILCLEGLAERLPQRTVRLAEARNAYLEFARSERFADYQHPHCPRSRRDQRQAASPRRPSARYRILGRVPPLRRAAFLVNNLSKESRTHLEAVDRHLASLPRDVQHDIRHQTVTMVQRALAHAARHRGHNKGCRSTNAAPRPW